MFLLPNAFSNYLKVGATFVLMELSNNTKTWIPQHSYIDIVHTMDVLQNYCIALKNVSFIVGRGHYLNH